MLDSAGEGYGLAWSRMRESWAVERGSLNGEDWEGYGLVELELTHCVVMKLPRGFGLGPRMVESLDVMEAPELSLLSGELDALLDTCVSLLAFLFVRPSQFKRMLKSHVSPCFSQFWHSGLSSPHLIFRFLQGLYESAYPLYE